MKKIFLTSVTILILSGMLSVQNTNAQDNNVSLLRTILEKIAALKWEQTNIDLGKIPQNVPVKINYNLTNSGNAPLVITNVQTSCGCTGANFPKESIAPGKSAVIGLTFNASSVGVFNKTATVFSNTNPGSMTLEFKGEVVEAGK